MKKYINMEAILESFCYFLLSFLLARTTYNKEYLLYVTPRMQPFLYFASLVLFVWGCSRIKYIGKPKLKPQIIRCLVLLIPSLFLILPKQQLRASDVMSGRYSMQVLTEDDSRNSKNNTTLINGTIDVEIENQKASEEISKEVISNTQKIEENSSEVSLEGFDESKKLIFVSDEEFYDWLVLFYENIDDYEGYEVTIKGLVYKDEELMQDNEFAIVRMMMNCCVADLVTCGPVCIYENATELKEDDWIMIRGILRKGVYEGVEEPQIEVIEIKKAEKPEEEYIYPTY